MEGENDVVETCGAVGGVLRVVTLPRERKRTEPYSTRHPREDREFKKGECPQNGRRRRTGRQARPPVYGLPTRTSQRSPQPLAAI